MNNSPNKIRENIIKHLSNYDIQIENHNLTNSISIEQLYQVLKNFKYYELAGIYDDLGFRIDPKASGYDKIQQRPYSLLDAIKYNVVWHSHPFNAGFQDFPSIEDLHFVALNPQSVYLIVCESGVYVMSSLSNYVNIMRITKFYRLMQYEKIEKDNCNDDNLDYDNLQKNFLNGVAEKREDISKLCIRFIPLKNLNKNTLKSMIDFVFFKHAYKYHEKERILNESVNEELLKEFIKEALDDDVKKIIKRKRKN